MVRPADEAGARRDEGRGRRIQMVETAIPMATAYGVVRIV
jgi:hypothetical protein